MNAAHRAASLDVRGRAVDVSIGLGLIAWALVAVASSTSAPGPVRLALSLVDVAVGTGFVLRAPARATGRPGDPIRALPSLLSSALVYGIATPDWCLAAIVVHDAFALLALVSVVALGRSFAIFPARRAIVARGPYAFVRHPMFLAELGMVGAACSTRGALVATLVVSLVLVSLWPRVLAEERMLGADPAYGAYRARVRHRLLPGVF